MKTKNQISKLIYISLLISASLLVNAQERREEGNMVLEDVPVIPLELKSRLQQYINTRSASLQDWLPNNGGVLISTRFGNTSQFHTVNNPQASRNQITFFKEPIKGASYCPSEEYNGFLFTKDFGGNEFSQIYWFDMDARTYKMISDGESVNFGINWSNKGNKFAFTSTRRNKKDYDLYISDISSPKKAELKLDRGTGYWLSTDWSPNDDKLIVIQYLSSTKSNSFIFDIETEELTQINDPDKEAVFIAMAWNKNGDKIYVTTDEGREFSTLALYDVASKKYEFITESIPWNIGELDFNKSKTKAAFTVNENGFTRLYTLNPKTNTFKAVQGIPIGQIYSLNFHPTENKLGMVLNTAQTPGDIFTLNLENAELERWTTSEVGGLNTSGFKKPELIEYPTFDEVDGKKRMIPAFVRMPQNASGPVPVLISIHGGPESQYTPYFSSFSAYLTNELGVAVIGPNVRGSAGYGKSYLKLDNGFLRENSVKDIEALLDWIKDQPEFDSERIAVMGGSYGGYMVLSSMFNYNERIKCGIDIVGISNFVTFLENTEDYRRDLRRVEYGDERIPEMREHLNSISPTTHVDKITKPLFVIQGANDPRVPLSEAEQMVKAVRENKGKVWYMMAKDEGHGFRKKENSDRMLEAIALFLKMHLLPIQN